MATVRVCAVHLTRQTFPTLLLLLRTTTCSDGVLIVTFNLVRITTTIKRASLSDPADLNHS
jgi:hypothetical protein